MGQLHFVNDVAALLGHPVRVALVREEEAARARADRDGHLARGAVKFDRVHLLGRVVVVQKPWVGFKTRR